jgi:hypothetical protein
MMALEAKRRSRQIYDAAETTVAVIENLMIHIEPEFAGVAQAALGNAKETFRLATEADSLAYEKLVEALKETS